MDVRTELYPRATAAARAQADEDLQVGDPEPEVARAALRAEAIPADGKTPQRLADALLREGDLVWGPDRSEVGGGR